MPFHEQGDEVAGRGSSLSTNERNTTQRLLPAKNLKPTIQLVSAFQRAANGMFVTQPYAKMCDFTSQLYSCNLLACLSTVA